MHSCGHRICSILLCVSQIIVDKMEQKAVYSYTAFNLQKLLVGLEFA